MANERRGRRPSKLVLGGIVAVVLLGGVFVWVATRPATMTACTLAGVIRVSPGAASPEEAARAYQARTGSLTGPGAASDPVATDGDGPIGFDRRSKTEWRRDLGDGSYQKLVVEEVPGDGWHVVDANTCSESPA